MDKPLIGKLTKGAVGALSLALVLSLQPAGAALAQNHNHGGGGHGGGGHMSGGHMGGGRSYAGGGHFEGTRGGFTHESYGVRGAGLRSYGHGYYGGYRGYGGTRYFWGGLPFYFSGGYYYGDCAWLRERAEDTGSPYWYHRYHLCRAY